MVYNNYRKKRFAKKRHARKAKKNKVVKHRRHRQYNSAQKIPRPLNFRLGNKAHMTLTQDFTIYMDPKINSSGGTNSQASCGFTLCLNSLYPFQTSTASSSRIVGTDAIIRMSVPGSTSATWPTEYNVESPNPTTAFIMKGVYNQGDYSIGRKFSKALITHAKVEVFAEPIVPMSGVIPVQPGLLTCAQHNNLANPIATTTNAVDLKLLAPRQTKRINAVYTLSPSDGASAKIASRNNTSNVRINSYVNVAKSYNVSDLLDNQDDFGFSLGLPTDTGTTPTAGEPTNKCYLTTAITPAMTSTLSGETVQAPSSIIRVRLSQKVQFSEPRTHSQTAGVDWNLPKAYAGHFLNAYNFAMGGMALKALAGI